MARYIDAEKVISKLNKLSSSGGMGKAIAGIVITIIESIPIADVDEVKHGEWQKSQFTGRSGFYSLRDYVCSECKIYSTFVQDGIKHPMSYCPNCGAKMEGGKAE